MNQHSLSSDLSNYTSRYFWLSVPDQLVTISDYQKICGQYPHSASSPGPGLAVLSGPVASQEADSPHWGWAGMHSSPVSLAITPHAQLPYFFSILLHPLQLQVSFGPFASPNNHTISAYVQHASGYYFHSFNKIYFR